MLTFAIILFVVGVIATIIGYWPRDKGAEKANSAPHALVKRQVESTLMDTLGPRAKQAIQSIAAGERCLLAIRGAHDSALVGTDRRVIVYKRGVTAGAAFGQKLNSYNYGDITGVEVSQTLGTLGVILNVPGTLPVTERGAMDSGPSSIWEAPNAIMVSVKDQVAFNEAIAKLRQLVAGSSAVGLQAALSSALAAAAPANPRSDAIEEVRRLAELRDEGLLTEDEFQAKKRKLLGL